MSRVDGSATERDGGEKKTVHFTLMASDRCREYVDDGVGGADFVKMHFIGRNSVNPTFGLRQFCENCDGGLFDGKREFTAHNQTANLPPRAWPLVRGANNMELPGANCMDLLSRCFDPGFKCRDLIKLRSEEPQRDSDIDHGG